MVCQEHPCTRNFMSDRNLICRTLTDLLSRGDIRLNLFVLIHDTIPPSIVSLRHSKYLAKSPS